MERSWRGAQRLAGPRLLLLLHARAAGAHSRHTAQPPSHSPFPSSQPHNCSDLWPDAAGASCYSAWNASQGRLPSYVSRDARWHHVAVTWEAGNNGRTIIYKDGLVAASADTGRTRRLEPGGALMLGGEQDCYGGCTER